MVALYLERQLLLDVQADRWDETPQGKMDDLSSPVQ
jgi:hypothetical protein